MVVNIFYMDEVNAKWLGYLAISLCMNALIICNVEVGLPQTVLSAGAISTDAMSNKMQQVRVALKTMVLSAPPVLPILDSQTQPVIKKQKPVQQQRMSKPVVSTAHAQKTVLSEHVASETIAHDRPTAEPVVESSVVEPAIIEKIVAPAILKEEVAKQAQAQAQEAKLATAHAPVIENQPIVSASMGDKVNALAEAQDNTAETAVNNITLEKALNHQAAVYEAVVHEAKYRKKTVPNYPRRAWELGQQGVVLLHAKVMPSGYPDEIKVVGSSGYRLLDKAALAAVKQWAFVPTSVNGQAVSSWVSVPVNFVIQ